MARATKKRRNASKKFKWTKELIFLIVFLCVIGLATGLMSIESSATKLYNEITEAQASKLGSDSSSTVPYMSEENVFKKIEYKDLLKKIATDEYTFVYYGSTDDSTFLTYIETVNSRAKEYDVSRVYLYSSDWALNLDLDDEDDGKANKQKLVDRENSLCGVDLETAPNLWVFKNGKLLFEASKLTSDSYSSANWYYVIEQAFGSTAGSNQ